MSNREMGQAIALSAIRSAVNQAEQILPRPDTPAAQGLQQAAKAAAIRIVTQDPSWRSWRIWSALWGLLSLVLMQPGAQEALTHAVGAYIPAHMVPTVAVLIAAASALISKRKDPRPAHVNGA